MSHPIPGHHYDDDLEHALESLPDQIAAALHEWRLATLNRQKVEALLYAKFKGEDKERLATEIKHLIHADGGRYEAVLEEVKAESNYTRLLEKHLSNKKRIGYRTAF